MIFSDSLYTILDLKPNGKLLNKTDILNMVHPNDKHKFKHLFVYIQEHQISTHDVETRIITSSDQIKFLSTRIETTFDQSGEIEHVYAIVEDITTYRNVVNQWSFTKRTFDSFIAHSSDAIVFLDTKLRITSVNASAEKLFGWSKNECVGLRMPMVPPAEQQQTLRRINEILSNKTTRSYEAQRQRKDGTLIDVSVNVTLMTDDYDEPVGLVAVYRDIGDRVALHRQISDNEQHLRDLMLYSANVVVMVDRNQIINYVSPAVENTLGYRPESLLGITFHSIVHPDDFANYSEAVRLISNSDNHIRIEVRLRHQEQEWRVFSLAMNPTRNESGCFSELVFNFHDVTEENQLKSDAIHQSTHDSITGLANHQFLNAYLNKLCSAEKTDSTFAFLHIELKDFRSLFGGLETHLVDQFMRAIANRIQKETPADAFVARINDLHFGIVIPYHNVFYVAQLAERIIESFEAMIQVDKHQILIPARIGVCLRNNTDMSSKTVWINAAYALTMVGHRRTNKKYFIYDTNLDVHSFKYHQLTEDLSSVILNDQLEVYYQPRVNGATGEILGAEALVRWNHPQWGIVLPGDFIPQAEATGFIEQIGEWVLKTACRQMHEWHRMGHPGLIISVNFSPRQFIERDIETVIAQTLEESNLNPMFLEIEVTENGYSDIPTIATTLANLKSRLGVRVAIDDFGTGEASLLVLRELDPDIIKIDRSLIVDVSENPKSLSIVHAVQEMARAL